MTPREDGTVAPHSTPNRFEHHHPLGFRLADDRGQPSIYIVDESSRGQTLHLIVSNTAQVGIELPASGSSGDDEPEIVGEHLPTPEDHHLEILFRPGTFELRDLSRISTLDTDWHLRALKNDDGTLSLFLSRPYGLVIPAGGVLTISLAHVRAKAAGGSRSTQAELRYRHLRYLGQTEKLSSHRLAHLDVVNRRGRADSPMAVGWIGSNIVLNDGQTRNTLTLYLGNPALKPLSLAAGELQVRPRLLLSFDSGQLEDEDEPWALGHADEVAAIEITTSDPEWIVHENEESETPEWIVLPPEGQLAPNQWINFTFYPIVSRAPSGFTYLYVTYQNVPGFRDGRMRVPIEKGPRLYRQQPVATAGAPQVNPESRRSVNAFADSVVIGNGYARQMADDTPTPPTFPNPGSLLVEGSVGIGVQQPEGQLHVGGRLRVDGEYYGFGHVLLHAYEGDGKSGTAYLQARDTSNSSSVAMQLRTQKDGQWVDVLRLTPEGVAKASGTIEDKHGPLVPIGSIMMWCRYQGREIPPGWALCDGSNGTPDLRGRFIVGAGKGTYLHGENFDFPLPNWDGQGVSSPKGGRLRVTLSEGEMPSHQHRGQTDADGAHYHHVPVWSNQGLNKTEYPPGNRYQFKDLDQAFDKIPDRGPTTSTFPSAHSHHLTTERTGGGGSHENLPPFFVLLFIMKIA